MITRRCLIIGVASVVGAALVPPVAAVIPAAADADEGITAREMAFWWRFDWAYDGLMAARDRGDFEAWSPLSRNREKLARLWVDLRALDDPSEYELLIRDEVESLWFALTRPHWYDLAA